MLQTALRLRQTFHVAPYAGAWIEIPQALKANMKIVSHPTRVRGLKSLKGDDLNAGLTSHPTRVRGLKFLLCEHI